MSLIPASASAVDLLAAMRSGTFTAVALVEKLLQNYEDHKDLGAISYINPEQVLKSAKAADDLRKSGKELPLLGLPVGVKDNIDTIELPTTAGTPAFANHHPKKNAPLWQRLSDQGAILFGKTAMHELAFGSSGNNEFYGPTRNPFDRSLIAGGSSSGTAAAIAGSIIPVGLGTDTGGSVRLPAAFCGISALRPTTGRYPNKGIIPISETRDTAGPMARTFADLRLLDDVITANTSLMPEIEPSAIRLGVPDEYFFDNLDEQTSRNIQQSLAILSAAGVQLIAIKGEKFGQLYNDAGFTVTLSETRPTIEKYLAYSGMRLTIDEIISQIASADVKFVFEEINAKSGVEFERAYRRAIDYVRPELQSYYSDVFVGHKLDGIIFPTSKIGALPIGQDTIIRNGKEVQAFELYIQNTGPGSLAGVPGIAIPFTNKQHGLPFGLSIDGQFWSDRHLLNIGITLEKIFGQLK